MDSEEFTRIVLLHASFVLAGSSASADCTSWRQQQQTWYHQEEGDWEAIGHTSVLPSVLGG